MSLFEQQVSTAREWCTGARFAGIVRLHSPREVAEQQGTIQRDYTIARSSADAFYRRLRALFSQRRHTQKE